jgi:YesN/AraC family two-component response regulator
MSDIRVLIVDDEDDMRALVSATIEMAHEGLSVAGEAADGAEAIAMWRAQRPEVVVLDERMPGQSGIQIAERILAEDPDQAIVLFTAYPDPELFASATRLGVRVCLAKPDIRRLPDAIWALGG